MAVITKCSHTGELISLSFFGTTIIVTSSQQIAIDLLEKRSSIYSDRVCPPAVAEASLMNWEATPAIVGYNESWRKYRRMMHSWLNKHAVSAFHRSQQRQARYLLRRLLAESHSLSTSEELKLELYNTTSSSLLESIYGYSTQSLDDPIVIGMKDVATNVSKAAIPTNWFPGTGWKTTLRLWGQQKDNISETLLAWAKSRMAAGDEPSIVASLLKESDKWANLERRADSMVNEVGLSLFGGGTETTADTLVVFVLAMLLFPKVQSLAQKEIDEVVGTSRLPSVDDQTNLPYVQRLIQEVLRWQPILPLGIPHVCVEDNEYQGYGIPRGAMIIGNVWAMSRDKNVYQNPEVFDPDRYLDSNVPSLPAFGWGRRICPGIHYAHTSLFIVVASILASFNISMREDDAGNPMVPTTEGIEDVFL
ncbi:cytochrome P450 family protein [Ceratobasidium sp. AG-Ba]|nr:cytochrome P450 family protein [Ceratobasidium sp. AG-Ba]